MVDPARFQQVIWNLLRNAVKFTPPAGTITLQTLNMPRGGAEQLQIKVTDTGVGIDPAALEKIFQPFEQSNAAGDHRFGGLGLGLAIAKSVVDLHQGKIWAESPGSHQGAVFIVELPAIPFSEFDEADSTERASSQGPPLSTLRRLLLVEDHAPTLQVLTKLLQNSGYTVVTAGKVAEALAIAATQPFDLVISDLGLPDGTGIQLMEKLKQDHGLRGIALSGYGMEADIQRTQAAGFTAHLVKPIRIADLRKILSTFS